MFTNRMLIHRVPRHRLFFHRILHVTALSAALAVHARAADYFVDARTGNDADSGVTRQFAWRTLTHAVATVPAGTALAPNVLHVAAGTYGVQTQETFPLEPRDFVHIVGYGGVRATVVEGGQTPEPLFRCTLTPFASSGRGLVLAGMTLRHAANGLAATSTDGTLRVTVRDVRIARMSGAGVFAEARFGQNGGVTIGAVDPLIQRSEITLCGTAISVSSYGFAGLTLEDSLVADNFGEGLAFSGSTASALRCERTRFFANTGVGLFAGGPTQGNGSTTVLRDCVFVSNAVGGVSLRSVDPSFHQHTLTAERCTFASNGVAGLDLSNPFGGSARPASLSECIFWGNSDDVRENASFPSGIFAERCDIGDGDFAGVNGNFAADPLFRDPATGDVRLRFGSPCIDVGSNVRGLVDRDGVARLVDGDLDTQERNDLGAHEFQPLAIVGAARIGTDLVLELAGPPGGTAFLYLKRGPLAATPLATPFGDFDLAPGASLVAQPLLTSNPVTTQTIAIADAANLVGKTYTLQALIPSAVAPNGAANSNAVSVVIGP